MEFSCHLFLVYSSAFTLMTHKITFNLQGTHWFLKLKKEKIYKLELNHNTTPIKLLAISTWWKDETGTVL